MTDLSYLSSSWELIESDPGLFTLLIEDFGCKNVQVEEIYDLSKNNLIDGHVYGFIFLFKWIEERRSRHRTMFINNTQNSNKSNQNEPYYVDDEQLVNSIFFAHQMIPNSCATHSIISILLNCNNIDLGENLNRLKEITLSMDPESKGLAIGNMPELAKAHNQHASEIDIQERRNKQPVTKIPNNSFPRQTSGDSFHFISFVNINNRVYELDGLKKYPIDHGPIDDNETFSEKFRTIILERIPQQQQKENKLNLQLRKLQTDMNTTINEDIRYSLMAVVPDKRKENLKKLKLLKSKRTMLLEILSNLIKPTKLPEPYETHSYSKYSITTLQDNDQLELNSNKFIIKDINYNQQLNNNNNLTNNNNLINNNLAKDYQQKQQQDDDGFSTDTCSCDEEFKFSDDDEDDDENDNKLNNINNLYAFKFMPLKEQNNIDNKTEFKTFTKTELIDFYQDYGLNDLLKMLNKLDQEINVCNRNLNDEIEKRNKYYRDDSRRTHNYNDFISTYLLMLTEQKKLNEFIDIKDNKLINNKTNNDKEINKDKDNDKMELDKDVNVDENLPVCYKFFKEILTNYEDVIMNEEDKIDNDEKIIEDNQLDKSSSNQSINNTSTKSINNNTTVTTTKSINNTTTTKSINNNTSSTNKLSRSLPSTNQIEDNITQNNRRKYSRRSSNSLTKNNVSNSKNKEKIK